MLTWINNYFHKHKLILYYLKKGVMYINITLIAKKDFVPAHMFLPTSDTYNKLIEKI